MEPSLKEQEGPSSASRTETELQGFAWIGFAIFSVLIGVLSFLLPWVFVGRGDLTLSAFIFLLGGVAILLRVQRSKFRRAALAVGLCLVVAGGSLGWPSSSGVPLPWVPFSDEALQQAHAEGKPVLIDFYASWCGPCRVLEREVMGHPDVASRLEALVLLRADMSDASDPEVQTLKARYGIMGFPTVIFLDAQGEESPRLRLLGVESVSRFAQRLDAVINKKPPATSAAGGKLPE